jgi:hypothetical protein
MGSLNDIIFFKDKKLLIDENNELDKLKSELYKECTQLMKVTYKKRKIIL